MSLTIFMITYLQIIVEKSKILNTLKEMGMCVSKDNLQRPDKPSNNSKNNQYSDNVASSPQAKRSQKMHAEKFQQMAYDLSIVFFKEVEINIQKLKGKIQKIQDSKDGLQSVEVEQYSFQKSEMHYHHIRELKYQEKAFEKDQSTQIVQQMLEPYVLAQTFIKEKQILEIDMYYFFNALLRLLRQGQLQNERQFAQRITFLGKHRKSLLSPFVQDLARQIKLMFKKIQQQQKKEEEEEKFKIKIEEQQSLIQKQQSERKQSLIRINESSQELNILKDCLQDKMKIIQQLEQQLRQHKYKTGETLSMTTDTTPQVSIENQSQEVKTLSELIEKNNVKTKQLSHLLEHKEEIIKQYLLRIKELEGDKNSLEAKLSREEIKVKETILKADADLNCRSEDTEKLMRQVSAKAQQLKKKDQQVSSLELRIKELAEVSNKQKEEIEKLERESHLMGEQVKKISQILKKKDEEITKQQSKIQDLQNKLASAQIKLETLQKQLNELSSRKQDPSSEIEEVKQLNKKLMTELAEYRSSQRIRSKSFIEHKVLFTGYILEKKKQIKKFLIEVIERNMLKSICRTDKVYEFARDRKNIFHEFIDGKSNLVIIIETAKNNLIAGYYSGKYAEKTLMNQEGILFSLTNFKYYLLNNFKNNPKKNKKETKPMCGMVYDDYFLIFGNSEIRIRHGQSKIYSNFGLGSSYFMSQGDKVGSFLCEGEKVNEVEFINYEIYELFFDEEIELCQT